MKGEVEISFEDASFCPIKIPSGENLSEHLNACNSPILFGCRSGLCGTCLIEVIEGNLPSPNKDEEEALDVYSPNNPRARLACQLFAESPLKICKIREQS
jgi:ferredoxin